MSNFRIIINEDNDHYFKQPAFEMTERGLRDYVDKYADGGVDTISFCPYGPRANYPSGVCDSAWSPLMDGSQLDGSLPEHSWPKNLEKMFGDGLDPYAVWIDQCRRRGMTAWLSIRMNDCHHTHPSLRFRADRRWGKHLDWLRDPAKFDLSTDKDWQHYQDLQAPLCWNYAHPEVSQFIFSVIEECASRYDADAIELDFCRDCFCLTPGHAAEEAPVLTALLQKCRDAFDGIGKSRGRRLGLVARVPWTPTAARAWGFDVAEWASRKLVDTVIASTYWRSTPNEFPVAEWKTTVGEAIPVYPATDQWLSPGPDAPIYQTSAAFTRGWCDNMAGQGAEGVYLFNFGYFLHPGYINPGEDAHFRDMLDATMCLEQFQAGPRRYQPGYVDMPVPETGACTGVMPMTVSSVKAVVLLPVNTLPGPGRQVRVYVSQAPEDPSASVELALNGIPVGHDGLVPASALKHGQNEVSLISADGQPHVVNNVFIDIFLNP